MKKAEIVFHSTRPPSIVWEFLSNLETAVDWVPNLVSVEKCTAGEVGVGTRYAQVVELQGRRSASELVITAFDPPRLFAHDGEGGPAKFSARFELEPIGAGTRVTHTYSLELGGPARIMEAMIGAWVRKNTEESIENLRRMIESSARGR